MTNYIGFYWTLPVPWAGLNKLPSDVDQAAERSRTIRYQRDLVRRWVKDDGGTLIGEQVFLELAPDRGSDQILPSVNQMLRKCGALDAKLVLIDFSEAYGWRSHGPLHERLRDDPNVVTLDPAPILIDGKDFDPVAHFRAWRDIEQTHASDKTNRKAHIKTAINQLSTAHETAEALVLALNADGITTVTGKPWTTSNLQKFLQKI